MKESVQSALVELERGLDAARRATKAKTGLLDPIRILPYRGMGGDGRLRLRGRVLEEEGLRAPAEGAGTLAKLRAMLRRYESDEIPGARVEARIGGRRHELVTDEEGFFELEVEGVELTSPWTDVALTLLAPLTDGQDNPVVTGRVRVPGPAAKRLVISDVDDTIVRTGATDFLKHARTVLLNDARSREAFAGVAPFYRALEAGPGGDEENPIVYVSSSPWNLYDLLETFLELHDIPLGPILLKDFGLDETKLFKTGHVDYKASAITQIADAYPDLDLILVGDSGQKDAWVFEEVVTRRPDRVVAGYLRDLDPERPAPEIQMIEERLERQGVPVRRVPHMGEAADHACEMGLIDEAQRAETKERVVARADV